MNLIVFRHFHLLSVGIKNPAQRMLAGWLTGLCRYFSWSALVVVN
jgi:hypothetical protein